MTTEKKASRLTDADIQAIINKKLIARNPRYKDLLDNMTEEEKDPIVTVNGTKKKASKLTDADKEWLFENRPEPILIDDPKWDVIENIDDDVQAVMAEVNELLLKQGEEDTDEDIYNTFVSSEKSDTAVDLQGAIIGIVAPEEKKKADQEINSIASGAPSTDDIVQLAAQGKTDEARQKLSQLGKAIEKADSVRQAVVAKVTEDEKKNPTATSLLSAVSPRKVASVAPAIPAPISSLGLTYEAQPSAKKNVVPPSRASSPVRRASPVRSVRPVSRTISPIKKDEDIKLNMDSAAQDFIEEAYRRLGRKTSKDFIADDFASVVNSVKFKFVESEGEADCDNLDLNNTIFEFITCSPDRESGVAGDKDVKSKADLNKLKTIETFVGSIKEFIQDNQIY
jgi:hypothetical protein